MHIILMGFKHVGKTAIGKQLAEKLSLKFIDVDDEIEKFYALAQAPTLNCRQIYQSQGDAFFRALESEVLAHVLSLDACVIALGGGTPMHQSNQTLLKSHQLVHIVAPRQVVFERMMADGLPSFFDPNEDPREFFERLWDERAVVYKKLAMATVDNNGVVEKVVDEIVEEVLK